MNVIRIPKLKSEWNPDRPISSLLLKQVEHLQHAERRLPLRYRTEIYTHAIQTEGEAARYIREVTEAIHQAHADAGADRNRRTRQRKRQVDLAASAEKPAKKRTPKRTAKRKAGSSPKRKGRK